MLSHFSLWAYIRCLAALASVGLGKGRSDVGACGIRRSGAQGGLRQPAISGFTIQFHFGLNRWPTVPPQGGDGMPLNPCENSPAILRQFIYAWRR